MERAGCVLAAKRICGVFAKAVGGSTVDAASKVQDKEAMICCLHITLSDGSKIVESSGIWCDFYTDIVGGEVVSVA